MAAEKQGGLVGPGLLVVVLAAIGIFIPRQSLDSGRPMVMMPAPVRSMGRERVPARLWEDPLGAIRRAGRERELFDLQTLNCPPVGNCESPNGHEEDCSLSSGQLLILTVFVRSGHYPEDEELRRRTRYAVQTALNIEGYYPTNPEHIGALPFRDRKCKRNSRGRDYLWSGCGSRTGAGAPEERLFPFEFFQRSSASAQVPGKVGDLNRSCWNVEGTAEERQVLVLWVPEEEFGDELLRGTHALLKHLVNVLTGDFCLAKITHAFMGPTTTDRLVKLVKEDARLECCTEDEPKPGCGSACPFEAGRLISAWATGRETSLLRLRQLSQAVSTLQGEGGTGKTSAVLEYRSPRPGGAAIQELRLRCGLGLTRQIGTDDLLVDLLVDEIESRGVDLAEDEIVLLGEFGSSYSKMFLEWFEYGGGRERGAASAQSSRIRNVRLRAYPRGLDGVIPDDTRRGSGGGDAELERTAHDVLEQPFGRSQVDYVRRLQQELQGGSYKAIGVVGQDVFDKLMLLRALREAFPRAILFTTDIDARYLQGSEYPSVRNLIIASHYPLTAQVDEGHDLQPLSFRGSYQTSNFYAAHRLIENFDRADGGVATKEKRRDMNASIYEVGRSGFIELPMAGSSQDLQSHSPWYLIFSALAGAFAIFAGLRAVRAHGERETPQASPLGKMWANLQVVLLTAMAGVGALVAVGSCLAFCWASGWGIRTPAALVLVAASLFLFGQYMARACKNNPERTTPVRIVAMSFPISCAVLGTLLVGIYIEAHLGGGEPLHWLEGVNVWPTIAARLVVMVISVVALVQLDSFLTRSYLAIGKRHLPREERLVGERTPALPRNFRSWIDCFRDLLVTPKPDPKRLESVWDWYQDSSRGRCLRVLTFFVGVIVVLASVYGMDQAEGFLARGRFAIWLDMSSWGLSLTALACLMFFVAAATLRSCRFVRLLFTHPVLEYWEEGRRRGPSHAKRGEDLEGRARDPLYVIRLAAEATDVASKLSWYPFALLLVLILSQTTYIDNWSWSLLGAGFCVIGVLAIVGSAIYLRRCGEALRGRLVSSLKEELLRKRPEGRNSQTRQRIAEILAIRRGAFLPLLQHPVVAAMLLPFGGIGTIALLEFLNRS